MNSSQPMVPLTVTPIGTSTLPAPHWCYEEKPGFFLPYIEEESSQLETIYSVTKGKGAIYLDTHTKEEKFVDFYKRVELRKNKARRVVRGTWFFENDDGLLVPYPEDTARLLEERFQSNPLKFEKFRVTAEPARFVEQRADGSFRQYRHTKNGTIQGRKVVRGYDGKLLVVDPSAIADFFESLPKLPQSPRDELLTTVPSYGNRAWEAPTVGSRAANARIEPKISHGGSPSATPTSSIASTASSRTLRQKLPSNNPANNPPLQTHSTSSHNLTRQRTLAAKEKLVELGLKLAQPTNVATKTQEEILSDASLRAIIKRLNEEVATLKSRIEALTKENKELKAKLEKTDAETRELEVMVVEKEMEVEDREKTIVAKEKLITNLMERIKNITGKPDVFVASEESPNLESTDTLVALKSLATVLDKADDSTKNNIMSEFSSIFENFTPEDFDEFADILSVNENE
eukprot:TRINITY_DN1477_c0_g1_i1.p1 TRINITY_DN1477_c0_g1~~TRINITY_DN1477_c0_g1_i1.p1  ORF type:complete len:460 (-),score=84.28 TRINITY_DN1477_c0_g1_i1:66-1445(-)